MYEHSFHIDYGAKAAAYVDAFILNINWETSRVFTASMPKTVMKREERYSARTSDLWKDRLYDPR